ncbi:hypothetical protein Pcinc_044478, partial [Petrolisthes cinctipes]
GYFITTPRRWISEWPAQFCVSVEGPNPVAGFLNVTIDDDAFATPLFGGGGSSSDFPVANYTAFISTTIDIPAGVTHQCHDIPVPATSDYRKELVISGSVSGEEVQHNVDIQFQRFSTQTYLQTDKYLYLPGQKVQLRALTVVGPELKLSTEQYPEVWVTTPSRTRIAQWKNVTTSNGLIHLDFNLIDEPEEGTYTIHLRPPQGRKTTTQFKVEDFVLPRFEVTLRPPPYILATDDAFSFSVCANYTFGQPVKGNLSITIDNNESKKCKVLLTRNITISGCTDIEATANELKIMDCNVYNLRVKAIVTEEGTEIEATDTTTVNIQRSAINFNTVYMDEYMKPNLPFTIKVRAEHPDNSVGVGVPVEVCAAGKCTNLTTGADGLITAVLPNYESYGVRMKALNCRVNMRSAELSKDLTHYFSPSNSSLLIFAPEDTLKCAEAGQSAAQHTLPVFFSARDQPTAAITVQIVSRGSIQYTNTQEYQLQSGPLPISTEHAVEPLQPPLPGTVRGVINLPISLPNTASPTVQVLIWYTRADGEVVSDNRELKVEKCLPHQVTLNWSTPKSQPGEPATITLTSLPEAVCSLGVVDKSSELLAADPDPINLDKLFNFINKFKINRYTNRQVNDYDYCSAKALAEAVASSVSGPSDTSIRFPRRYHYYTDYVDALTMFENAGVFVFTNNTIETRPCEREGDGGIILEDIAFASPALAGRPPPQASFAPAAFGGGSADREGEEGTPRPSDTAAPRTNFPETWLWDLVVIPASGVSEQAVTVPDTITQWVGKAVCAHPQEGIGLSAKSSITAFTPFFVDLTLPPKMKRGEILPVKMSVFNYLDRPLPVSLTLEPSPEYEILKEAPQEEARGKRSACVPPNDKVVLTVRIKPSEIADVNISVSAAVDETSQPGCGAGLTTPPPQRRDALIKPIKVVPEGFLRENSWSKYICSKDFETGEDAFEPWPLTLPPVLVEGSARGWVTAVGDLLALTLQ